MRLGFLELPAEERRLYIEQAAARGNVSAVMLDADGWELEAALASYFKFYCYEGGHQSLGYRTPAEVYRPGDSSPPSGEAEKQQQVSRKK